MVDNEQEAESRKLSPVGAMGILVAWLAFRFRLTPESLANCMQSINEALYRANARAYQLGWIEDPPDSDWVEPTDSQD